MQKIEKKSLGVILERIGFLFFVLLFWYPFGFFLGGDAYFFGPFDSSLELYFPYAGIGVFLLFLGSFFQGKFKNISENQLLYFLVFLAIIGLTSNASGDPSFSILFLILWAIGFFGAVMGDVFCGVQRENQISMAIGILAGYLAMYAFPLWNISLDLLAIMSLYLLVFLRLSGSFRYQWVLYLLVFYMIALSQNLGLIGMGLFLWLGVSFWMPRRSRFSKVSGPNWIWAIVFVGLILWHWEGLSDSNTENVYMPLFQDWKTFFLGVGEGQFIPVLQNISPFYLLENLPRIPSLGAVLTFFEQGIIGVLLIISLGLSPLFFNRKKWILPIFLFFGFWIFSSDFLGTENGILLAMLFLFMKKSETG